MSRSRRQKEILLTLVVSWLTLTGACRSGPAASLGDPVIEAIRSEEREGGQFTYAESQGKRLFLRYCATCHGDEGRGDGQNASNLTPAPPDMTAPKSVADAVVTRRVIAEGSAAVGRSPLSPPWGRSLSRQQIDDLVSYCRRLGRQKR